ncbi:MAG: DNA-directed RNA polymerase subunit omega [Bacteroidia bacterium]|nr:DNA-directed RNA polymerase subunit omega [Bacteroidia bacterium]MDW8157688.1 DNA-directed RNA polymerase subunit omega [Bacteroidia bacterium]
MNIDPSIDTSIRTLDIIDLATSTKNIYKTVVLIGKRASQISVAMKKELNEKLSEFANSNDNLEEVSDNREQAEVAKKYELYPKPTLIAIHEFLNNKLKYYDPSE